MPSSIWSTENEVNGEFGGSLSHNSVSRLFFLSFKYYFIFNFYFILFIYFFYILIYRSFAYIYYDLQFSVFLSVFLSLYLFLVHFLELFSFMFICLCLFVPCIIFIRSYFILLLSLRRLFAFNERQKEAESRWEG